MPNPIFHWPGQRPNDPAHRRVAEFLVMDIQQSPAWAQDLLEKVEAIQAGNLRQWQRVGNAFCLDLSLEGATIDDLVDETTPPQTVPLEEFHQAVVTWLEQAKNLEHRSQKPGFFDQS
jgi:hypothetical protein